MVKLTKAFFITVGLAEVYDTVREDFLSVLASVSDINCYCVAVETFHKAKGTYHLHSYVAYTDGVPVAELSACVRLFATGVCDIQPCKSKKSVLKYITKEDPRPLFNCPESCLSFAYRSRAWAKSTRTFSFADPFVLEHPNYHRILQSLHSEVRGRCGRVQLHFEMPNEWYVGWPMRVLDYFARAFRHPRNELRALYLHGYAGTGKSRCVEELLGFVSMDGGDRQECGYSPVPGQFFFGDYVGGNYSHVIFEEWAESSFKGNWWQIKRLMEGKPFKVDVKFGGSRVLRVVCPVVFVSNEYPPQDPAFLRRIVIVDADEKVYEKPKAIVPKVEAVEVDTIVVSSSEEADHSEEEVVHPQSIQAVTPP